jgi:GH24 family phage-related lysozyme (muramidase)
MMVMMMKIIILIMIIIICYFPFHRSVDKYNNQKKSRRKQRVESRIVDLTGYSLWPLKFRISTLYRSLNWLDLNGAAMCVKHHTRPQHS